MSSVNRVLVIGGGAAGLSAALAASEAGAEVELWDAAPAEESGGSTAYATGTIRVPFDGLDDLARLLPDLSADEIATTDFGSYPEAQFFEDLGRLSGWRTDPDLAAVVVDSALDTWAWLADHGVGYVPMFGRQAIREEGRTRFWGGLVVEISGGGTQLVERLTSTARERGITIRNSRRATALVLEGGRVAGARAATRDGSAESAAQAVVVATGGFESNAQWRAAYLGRGWDLARVRGSRFSLGDGIRMMLDVGAVAAGNWSGAHACAWEGNAPPYPTRTESSGFSRHSYPFGILVNANGERFVDEGADFRNYTYGLLGEHILAQPAHRAWQIFDAKVSALLREEYRGRAVTRASAATIEGLAERVGDIDPGGLARTVAEFNSAVDSASPFDPATRDGRAAMVGIPKRNWAQALDAPPFEAYEVVAGITYTYGGIRVAPSGAVLDASDRPIPQLFAAGNVIGGLFYENSPSGASLTASVVLGRRAGQSAGTI